MEHWAQDEIRGVAGQLREALLKAGRLPHQRTEPIGSDTSAGSNKPSE